MDPLLTAFARHLDLAPAAARPILDALLAEIRADVLAHGSKAIPEIGVFKRGRNGLVFEPDDDLVAAVNVPYLGLPPIKSKRPPMPTESAPPPAPAPAPAPPPSSGEPEPPAPTDAGGPPVFSVPLEPADTPEEPPDPFAETPPPPRVSPEAEHEPLRDLSSEPPEPSAEEGEAGNDAGGEGADDDLDALIAGMRASAEALKPRTESDYDFFGTPVEGESDDEPASPVYPDLPAEPPPSTPPPSVPPRPRAEPRPTAPPPSAHVVEPVPEERRRSAWTLLLPLLFVALIAAAIWLWPRFDPAPAEQAVVPPVTEPAEPTPLLVTPDSLAGADSLARADSLAEAEAADTTSVATPEPVVEPPPPVSPAPPPDPLRGSAPIDVAQGGWGWVFGSGNREGAERDAARWRRLGFRTAAVAGTSNGRPVYRVYVGQFATREAAREATDRLPAGHPPDAWVRAIGP